MKNRKNEWAVQGKRLGKGRWAKQLLAMGVSTALVVGGVLPVFASEPEVADVPEVQQEQPVVQAEQPVVQAETPMLQSEQPVVQAEQPAAQSDVLVEEIGNPAPGEIDLSDRAWELDFDDYYNIVPPYKAALDPGAYLIPHDADAPVPGTINYYDEWGKDGQILETEAGEKLSSVTIPAEISGTDYTDDGSKPVFCWEIMKNLNENDQYNLNVKASLAGAKDENGVLKKGDEVANNAHLNFYGEIENAHMMWLRYQGVMGEAIGEVLAEGNDEVKEVLGEDNTYVTGAFKWASEGAKLMYENVISKWTVVSNFISKNEVGDDYIMDFKVLLEDNQGSENAGSQVTPEKPETPDTPDVPDTSDEPSTNPAEETKPVVGSNPIIPISESTPISFATAIDNFGTRNINSQEIIAMTHLSDIYAEQVFGEGVKAKILSTVQIGTINSMNFFDNTVNGSKQSITYDAAGLAEGTEVIATCYSYEDGPYVLRGKVVNGKVIFENFILRNAVKVAFAVKA